MKKGLKDSNYNTILNVSDSFEIYVFLTKSKNFCNCVEITDGAGHIPHRHKLTEKNWALQKQKWSGAELSWTNLKRRALNARQMSAL